MHMGAERYDSKVRLLQLFGWNAKSRKKLVSPKFSVSELSKPIKRDDGSLPSTLLHLVDEDDALTGSSLKESSDFSSVSSVTDEEFGVLKRAGIVARLMGLDSLPTTHDVLDTHSTTTTYYDTQSLQDLNFQSKKLEKQQDYHLISSGNLHSMKHKHYKSSNMPIKKCQTEVLPLESAKPIKRAKFQTEIAARIIRSRPQATSKAKVPVLASSSIPRQVKVMKEKVEAAQKPRKLTQTSLRKESTDTTSVKRSVDCGECSTSTNGIGKSISLALQAKANVQKRLNGTKTSVVPEQNQVVSSELFKGQQRQNSYGDSGYLSSELSIVHSQCWKPVNRDSSVARYTYSTKSADYKVVRRSISEVIDGRNEDTYSNTRLNKSHKKRSVERIFHVDQPIQSQPNKRQGMEIVSFTFKYPIMRPDCSLESSTKMQAKNNGLGDAHETKLRQTDEIPSRYNSVFISNDYQSFVMKCKIQGLNQEVKKHGQNDIDAKTVLEYRTPSPVSILEHSFLTESCNSSDTADSSIAGVTDSKQSSFVQAQEALSPSTRFFPMEAIASTSRDPSLSIQSEMEYVKKVVCDIDLMYENFATGKTSRIISSQLFIQLECQNDFKKRHLSMSRRKLLFDCVAECLDNRIQHHIGGGYKTWVEGLVLVKHKERLADDIFKDFSRFSATDDCMVDEFVYKDMSYKQGRWLDFEIESFELGIEVSDRMLNTLLDEVIADLL